MGRDNAGTEAVAGEAEGPRADHHESLRSGTMETPTRNGRSLSSWLKRPVVGPLLCLLLVYALLSVFPDGLAALVLWSLFAVGCAVIGRNVRHAVAIPVRRVRRSRST